MNLRIKKKIVPLYSRNNKRCLCDILKVMFFSCRIFGLTPITWTHNNGKKFIREDGQCFFAVSKLWITYSIALTITYNLIFFKTLEFNFGDNSKFLNSCNECAYYFCASFLTLFGILRSTQLVDTLNNISPLLQRGLMCQSSKLSLVNSNRYGFLLIVIQILIQIAAVVCMTFSDTFVAHNDFQDFLSRLVHNVPFMFYYLFCTICAMYVAIFMCFETAMQQTITNGMSRPIDDDKLGAMKFARCTGSHPDAIISDGNSGKLAEDIDSLRRLHEKIKLSLNSANKAFNPQLAVYLCVELGVIIIHSYSIILYLNLEWDTPALITTNFMDWIFITVHTFGLIIFLLSAQGIRTTQNGPIQQISEFSSKHLLAEEYAEMRLFALKLEYSPAEITAGCFFAIDISLVAPITGAVVTYLLVALQFKLTSKVTGNITDTEVKEEGQIIF